MHITMMATPGNNVSPKQRQQPLLPPVRHLLSATIGPLSNASALDERNFRYQRSSQRRCRFNRSDSSSNNVNCNAGITTDATDVNFNSPVHRSSLDGSFIQDDDNMQLILDFAPITDNMANKNDKTQGLAPPILTTITESWRGRNIVMASDFDANVAQLDFDDFSTGDIQNLKDQRYKIDSIDSRQITAYMDCIQDANNRNNNINRILMQNSLDFSLDLSGGSLFSSDGLVESSATKETGDLCETNKDTKKLPLTLSQTANNCRGTNAGLAFISVDSLDNSAFLIHEQNLKQACAPKKREYMLTFDNRLPESVSQDKLSRILGRSSRLWCSSLGYDSHIRKRLSGCKLVTRHRSGQSFNQIPTSLSLSTTRFLSLPDLHQNRCMLEDRFLPENSQSNVVSDCLASERSLNTIDPDHVVDKVNSSSTNDGDIKNNAEIPLAIGEEDVDETAPFTQENNQTPDYQPKFVLVDDYEYSEFYLNGRYIDVNHNEIGYAPPPAVSNLNNDYQLPSTSVSDDKSPTETDNCSEETVHLPPLKPTRTFATLLEENHNSFCNNNPSLQFHAKRYTNAVADVSNRVHTSTQIPLYTTDRYVQTIEKDSGKLIATVKSSTIDSATDVEKPASFVKTGIFSKLPDLGFASFPFTTPTLFPSLPTFPLPLLNSSCVKLSDAAFSPLNLHKCPVSDPNLWSHSFLYQQPLSSSSSLKLPAPPAYSLHKSPISTNERFDLHKTCRRDSGFGSSDGPMHIQDWESLAILLPKEVVQACSFFKVNSNLLVGDEDAESNQHIEQCKPLSPKLRCAQHRSVRQQSSQPHRCRDNGSRSRCHGRELCYCSDATRSCRNHCTAAYRMRPTACCYRSERSKHRCCSSHNTRMLQCGCKSNCLREHRKFAEIQCYHTVDDGSETTTTADEDDDYDEEEEGDYCLPAYCRSLCSEYYLNSSPHPYTTCADYSYFNDVPKFYSLQNVKELADLYSQPIGYPLKRPKNADVNCHCCLNETSSSKPCATCFRVRSPLVERRYHEFFCDCRTSDILEEQNFKCCTQYTENVVQPTKTVERTLKKFNDEERAAEKTQIYYQKQDLVNRVVWICDELLSQLCVKSIPKETDFEQKRDCSRSAKALHSLCKFVEKLVADGLLVEKNVWTVVQASATLGPATKSIYELVTDLSSVTYSKEECSQKFASFVHGLLRLRSLDCWLSYLVLKDKILREHYNENAFLQKAASAYKTLFNRLIMALQPLSMLSFSSDTDLLPEITTINKSLEPNRCMKVESEEKSDTSMNDGKKYSLMPTRLPSDSRIPNSSSVPSKLTNYGNPCAPPQKSISVDSGLLYKVMSEKSRMKSRIPLLKSSRSTTSHIRQRKSVLSESVYSIDASVFDEGSEGSDEYSAEDDERYVCAIDTVVTEKKGFLSFGKGETLVLLDEFDNGYLRCSRGSTVGLVDRCKVTYVTFL